jgi:hypothetical protein
LLLFQRISPSLTYNAFERQWLTRIKQIRAWQEESRVSEPPNRTLIGFHSAVVFA